MARILALVDGEHYPPVVRDAIAVAAARGEVVAALLLGGREKLDGTPDYGVPLERGAADPATAMVDAARRLDADLVLDLSDEPVLDEPARMRLAAHALAAGLDYAAPGLELRAPPRPPAGIPALAVIGTGKRIGKTAVAGHAARVLSADMRVVMVAMGRGGPAAPELVDGGAAPVAVADLLARARSGEHAASDYLEDAALAGVTTVGARRCGGGPAGEPFTSNVAEAVALARSAAPDLLLLEGSGAAIPPVAADRTVLVTSATRPVQVIHNGLGPYRVLVSDMVVVTMCEPPLAGADEIRAAVERVRPGTAVVATAFRPWPAEPVAGERVALFTTAPAAVHAALAGWIEQEHGAEVTAVVGSLSDRAALRADLDAPGVRAATTFLTAIKAAAIDVVAAAGEERGTRVVFCDNRPQPLPGEDDLDGALRRLAGEAVAAHA